MVLAMIMVLQPVMTSMAAVFEEGEIIPAVAEAAEITEEDVPAAEVMVTEEEPAISGQEDPQEELPAPGQEEAGEGAPDENTPILRDGGPVTITVNRYIDGELWGEPLVQTGEAGREMQFELGRPEAFNFQIWLCTDDGEFIIGNGGVGLQSDTDRTFNFHATFADPAALIRTDEQGIHIETDTVSTVTQQFTVTLDERLSWNTDLLAAGSGISRDYIDTGMAWIERSMNFVCDAISGQDLTFTFSGIPQYATDAPQDLHFYFSEELFNNASERVITSNCGDVTVFAHEAFCEIPVTASGTVSGDDGELLTGQVVLTLPAEEDCTWIKYLDDEVHYWDFKVWEADAEVVGAQRDETGKQLTLTIESRYQQRRHEPIVIDATGTIWDSDHRAIPGTLIIRDDNARWNIGALEYHFNEFDQNQVMVWRGEEKSEENRVYGSYGSEYRSTGSGYETEKWTVEKTGPESVFRGILIRRYDNGKCETYPSDRGFPVEEKENGDYVITVDPAQYPEGFELELITEFRPFSGEFRVHYSEEFDVPGTARYFWSKESASGDFDLEDNEGYPYLEGSAKVIRVTSPVQDGEMVGFAGVILDLVPMWGQEERRTIANDGQNERITDNGDGTWTVSLFDEGDWDCGFELSIFWTQDEFDFERMTDNLDWDSEFLVEIADSNGFGGSVVLDDSAEDAPLERHRRGNRVRVCVPRETEALSFSVDSLPGAAAEIWINGRDYHEEEIIDGKLIVERPEEGWDRWLHVDSHFEVMQAEEAFRIPDFEIHGISGEEFEPVEFSMTLEGDLLWKEGITDEMLNRGLLIETGDEKDWFRASVIELSDDCKTLTVSVAGTVYHGMDEGVVFTLYGLAEYDRPVRNFWNDNARICIEQQRIPDLAGRISETETTKEILIYPDEDGRLRYGNFELTLPEGYRFKEQESLRLKICGLNDEDHRIEILDRRDTVLNLRLEAWPQHSFRNVVEIELYESIERYNEGTESWETIPGLVKTKWEEGIRFEKLPPQIITMPNTVVCADPGDEAHFALALTLDEESGRLWSEEALNECGDGYALRHFIDLNIDSEWYQFEGWKLSEDHRTLALYAVIWPQEERGHAITVTCHDLTVSASDPSRIIYDELMTHENPASRWKFVQQRQEFLWIDDVHIAGQAGGEYTARLHVSISDEEDCYFDPALFTEDLRDSIRLDTHGEEYEISYDPATLTENAIDLVVSGRCSHARQGDSIYLEIVSGIARRWDLEPMFGIACSEYNENARWEISADERITVTGSSISGSTCADFDEVDFMFALPEGYSWDSEALSSYASDFVEVWQDLEWRDITFKGIDEDGILTLGLSGKAKWENSDPIIFAFTGYTILEGEERIDHQVSTIANDDLRWNISILKTIEIEDTVISAQKDQEQEFSLTLDLGDSGFRWDWDKLEDSWLKDRFSLNIEDGAYDLDRFELDEDNAKLTLYGRIHYWRCQNNAISVVTRDAFTGVDGELGSCYNPNARWNIYEEWQKFNLIGDTDEAFYAGDSRFFRVEPIGYEGDYSVEWDLYGPEECIRLVTDEENQSEVRLDALNYDRNGFRLEARISYYDEWDERQETLSADLRMGAAFEVSYENSDPQPLVKDGNLTLNIRPLLSCEGEAVWEVCSGNELIRLDVLDGNAARVTGVNASDEIAEVKAEITFTRPAAWDDDNPTEFVETRFLRFLVYEGDLPSFEVRYNADGGQGYVEPQRFYPGNPVIIRPVGYTKAGFVARYWVDDRGNRYSPGWEYRFGGSMDLMPEWLRIGWVQENGEWHYYNENGDMVRNEWVKDGTDLYFLNDDGNIARESRIDWDGEVFYVDASGRRVTNGWGIVWDGSRLRTMYLESSGCAVRDREAAVNGRVYSFDEAGFTVPDFEVVLQAGEQPSEEDMVIELCQGNPAGLTLPVPPNPAIDFYGWYTAGGEKVTDLGTLLRAVRLYPHGAVVSTAEYTVEHWLQTVDGTDFDLEDSEVRTGRTSSMTEAEAKEFMGFTAQAVNQKKIAGNGSTTVTIRYDRNNYTIRFNTEGTPVSAPDPITGVYGSTYSLPEPAPVEGMTFLGWYYGNSRMTDGEMPAFDMELIPVFAITDGWRYDGTGWQYYIDGRPRGEGWLGLPVGAAEDWYYLDGNGYMMQNALIERSGDIFYLGADGRRVSETFVRVPVTEDDEWTGLSERIYYFDGRGRALRNKLLELDEKCYYFDGGGKAAVGFTDGGYNMRTYDEAAYDAEFFFDSDGVMARNEFVCADVPKREKFREYDEIWFYFGEDGRKAYDRIRIAGLLYNFDPETGVVLTGKQLIFDPGCEDGEYEGWMDDWILFPGRQKNLPANGYRRDGYVFKGWEDAAGVFYPDGRIYTATNTRPVILYAVWDALEWITDIADCEHASVTVAEGSRAVTGENLVINVAPEKGYGTVSVRAWRMLRNGETGEELEVVTKKAGTQFSIKMPASDIRITACAAEMTVTAPSDSFTKAGKKAEFTVSTTGEGLSYQWQKKAKGSASWKSCSGSAAVTPGYSVTVTADMDGTAFRCVVKNSFGYTINSASAVLTIKPDLKISTQPSAQAAKSGKTVTFKVKATGDGLTYQWQYSKDGKTWTNVSGSAAKKTSLDVKVSSSYNGRQYRCVITDSDKDKLTSKAVKLTMKAAFKITTQPSAQAAKSGKSVTFKVVATGDKLTYQWQSSKDGKKWTDVSGSAAKKASLAVKVSKSNNGWQYRCVITDSDKDKLTSKAVKLTMKVELKITTQPKAQSVKKNATATFKVVATGDKLTYQWQSSKDGKKWTNVSGSAAKKASLAVKASSSNNGWQYRCVITDSDKAKVTSKAAKLTVK